MIYENSLLKFLFLSLLISCNDVAKDKDTHPLPENSKPVQVQLVDSLGIITLSVPLRYDTSFSWIHYSDCGKPCDEQKYRFQPKELPITKESGWIWLGEPKDSIDRFTISHSSHVPFHDGDTAKNFARHHHLKEQLMRDPQSLPIVFDTIQKINDRYFSIIGVEKFDTLYSRKVVAVTTIKSNVIKFQYELLTRKSDSGTTNFIKNAIDLIKTIHISKGI